MILKISYLLIAGTVYPCAKDGAGIVIPSTAEITDIAGVNKPSLIIKDAPSKTTINKELCTNLLRVIKVWNSLIL